MYVCVYIYTFIYICMYVYIYIYISGEVSLYLSSLLHQMKHLLSSMIYVNLEMVISPLWHEAFRFPSMTVAKVPLFPSLENMKIFIKVLEVPLSDSCSI